MRRRRSRRTCPGLSGWREGSEGGSIKGLPLLCSANALRRKRETLTITKLRISPFTILTLSTKVLERERADPVSHFERALSARTGTVGRRGCYFVAERGDHACWLVGWDERERTAHHVFEFAAGYPGAEGKGRGKDVCEEG